MKKLITAILIIAATACLLGCPGPSSPKDPLPNVDTTTLDGTYVITYTVGGKAVNYQTIVIDGESFTVYMVDIYVDTAAELDAAVQTQMPSYTISPNGKTCTIELEPGNTTTFTMFTNSTGTWLTSDNPIMNENYRKVPAGTLGKPTKTMDCYFGEASKFLLFTKTGNEFTAEFHDGEAFDGDGVSYNSSSVVKNTNVYNVSGNDWSYKVTIDGNSATVSDASDNFTSAGTTPATQEPYTRYVRTTPWPVVSAE